MQLFDVLDKAKEFDEDEVLSELKGVSKRQLINIKRNLYSQILKSLRLIYTEREMDLQIREQIDYARILYGKGLYLQSLKLLERIKKLAQEYQYDLLVLEIIEFEKMIELRHITRSRAVKNKVETLIDESGHINKVVSNSSKLANLNLKIQGFYIKLGHVRNEEHRFVVRDYFKSLLREIETHDLDTFDKAYLYQCYWWYNYIQLNFPYCYKHAKAWADLFRRRPWIIEKDPDLYMRSLYYHMTSLLLHRKKPGVQASL